MLQKLPDDTTVELLKFIRGRHGKVHSVRPAEMNGVKGYLGVSTLLYTRVWFQDERTANTVTLFNSFRPSTARQEYEVLLRKYGT